MNSTSHCQIPSQELIAVNASRRLTENGAIGGAHQLDTILFGSRNYFVKPLQTVCTFVDSCITAIQDLSYVLVETKDIHWGANNFEASGRSNPSQSPWLSVAHHKPRALANTHGNVDRL